MVSLVNSHTNANPKRWHLWEIDLRLALNSTPGWYADSCAPGQSKSQAPELLKEAARAAAQHTKKVRWRV